MEVGDKIYYYEREYRSYEYEDGTRSQGAIEEHKYREYDIIAETKVSWIISNMDVDINNITDSNLKMGIKVKKKGSEDIIFSSWKEVQKKLWTESHGYDIAREIEGMRSIKYYDKLKRILEIIGEE